jgi:hypothetical protein
MEQGIQGGAGAGAGVIISPAEKRIRSTFYEYPYPMSSVAEPVKVKGLRKHQNERSLIELWLWA